MKSILFIIVSLCSAGFSSVIFASETSQTPSGVNLNLVSSNYIDSCYSWTYLRAENGSYGYVCSSYPSRIQVPDYYSTQDTIRELEQRIYQLEARIEQLENNK